MGKLGYWQYSRLRTFLESVEYDGEHDFISLVLSITIPHEYDLITEQVLIGFAKIFLKTAITNETKQEAKVLVGFSGNKINTVIEFDPSNSLITTKFELFRKTLTALLKINQISDEDAKALTKDFITEKMPHYLKNDITVEINNKNIMVKKTPKTLLHLAANSVRFLLEKQQISPAKLHVLPQTLCEQFRVYMTELK